MKTQRIEEDFWKLLINKNGNLMRRFKPSFKPWGIMCVDNFQQELKIKLSVS